MQLYKVLLFYKYVDISNVSEILNAQLNICNGIGLLGRVLIANEGINGTLAGTEENCKKYIEYMNNSDIFNNIDWKESTCTFIPFEKLSIKHKKEIVSFGINPKTLNFSMSASYIKPQELHTLLESNPNNVILIDTRNYYESFIGRFIYKNSANETVEAITPNLKTFKEFPQYFKDNKEYFKDKDVIMYCTGGVRCERASALMKLIKSAKSVRHLEGGIHRYVELFPDGFFRGSNYVFDDRITIKINDSVLSFCAICKKSSDLYNNCLNALCNKHYVCCDECLLKFNHSCSLECGKLILNNLVTKRPPLKSRNLFDRNINII